MNNRFKNGGNNKRKIFRFNSTFKKKKSKQKFIKYIIINLINIYNFDDLIFKSFQNSYISL